jgi:hypothetical protein
MTEHTELPGLEFVFDLGLRKIEEQEKLMDAIDLKMSVFIAFYGALVIGLMGLVIGMMAVGDSGGIRPVVSGPSAIIFLGSVAAFVIGLFSAFQAYRPRMYYKGIRFADLMEYPATPAVEIRDVFLPTLRKATDHNDNVLAMKQRFATWAAWAVFIGVLGMLVGITEVAVRLFKG